MIYYLYFWTSLIIICVYLIIKNLRSVIFLNKYYYRFITIKWKFISFIIAITSIIGIGIIAHDPTWDVGISVGISSLYYYTAPYSIGIIYRYIRGIYRNNTELYIAIIIMFFSSSWYYDGYNYLLLLGRYPETWTSNIIFSLPIYILAGMFWSLEYVDNIGITFSFTRTNWLNESQDGNFNKVITYLIPITLLMVYIFGYYLYIFR